MAAAPVQSAASARVIALDNLRVVAMLLGLVTHGVLPYTATGLAQFPIRDCTRHPAADAVYFAVHDFRMQLFFLLAGFAAAALATRRGIGELARNRTHARRPAARLRGLLIGPLMHLLFAHHTASRGLAWNPADTAVGRPELPPLVPLLPAPVLRPARPPLAWAHACLRESCAALIARCAGSWGGGGRSPRSPRRRCRCYGTCPRGGSTHPRDGGRT